MPTVCSKKYAQSWSYPWQLYSWHRDQYDFLYLVLDLPGRVPLYITGQAEELLATLAVYVACNLEGYPAWQIKNRITDIVLSGPDARERVVVDLTNFENVITEHTASILFVSFNFPNIIWITRLLWGTSPLRTAIIMMNQLARRRAWRRGADML